MSGGALRRLLLLGAGAGAMIMIIAALSRMEVAWPFDREGAPAAPVVSVAASVTGPIAAEAQVFRSRPGAFAVDTSGRPRRSAHPRSLATSRALRAYAGAPPRIPHGLTGEEFRTARCRTCHERGGYSQRFGAYAPVTPHPELAACLQCHAVNDAVVGARLPGTGRDASCRQCHAAGATAALPVMSSGWQPAMPPRLARVTPEAPPVIPHDLQMRGNCLTCHMGQGAVAEIRTSHPERANCRQCHVVAGDSVPLYSRPTASVATRAGGEP